MFGQTSLSKIDWRNSSALRHCVLVLVYLVHIAFTVRLEIGDGTDSMALLQHIGSI